MAKEKQQPKNNKNKSEVTIAPEVSVVPRLKIVYKENVVPSLLKKFGYKNVMQVPRLEKIAINVGIGKAMSQDAKIIEVVTHELEQIVGQKVVVTKAKKSISNFKLREGVPVGIRVTLRSSHMYEFLDRFINIVVPRIRDFRGLSDKSFDGDRKSTCLNSSHVSESRMPSSA